MATQVAFEWTGTVKKTQTMHLAGKKLSVKTKKAQLVRQTNLTDNQPMD